MSYFELIVNTILFFVCSVSLFVTLELGGYQHSGAARKNSREAF